MGPDLHTVDGVVEEIMRIHRSLPPRPAVDEVDAAVLLVRNVEKEEQARMEAVARQKRGSDVPEELFLVLQEMQKNLLFFQSKDQKREALKLLELESAHALFDDLVQRASRCIPSSSNGSASLASVGSPAATTTTTSRSGLESFNTTVSSSIYSEKIEARSTSERFSRDDSYLKPKKSSIYTDGVTFVPSESTRSRVSNSNSTFKQLSTTGEDADKLSLIKLASMIEVYSKKGTRDLNLQGKLMDQIEWLPDSIGKLSVLHSLDLSENRIVALPNTIGGLLSLTRLDLHSNRIVELPDAIGSLLNLEYLDLRGNQLATLPSTFGKLARLVELDLSSNRLSFLPDVVGNLLSLRILNIETNEIDEFPHTIGNCTSLVELRADYNHLKCLPEAVGRLPALEILSVRYNNIKSLPTTVASLSNLREIDISFNELESVPESLCLVTTLTKINIGNNFADMRSLPRSIGNLEMLDELNISNNQIRVLPDSFGMLKRLRVLRAEENPLEVPPRDIAGKDAQIVVEYMADLVEKRNVKSQPVKAKRNWTQFCFLSRPNKRKNDGMDYVMA